MERNVKFNVKNPTNGKSATIECKVDFVGVTVEDLAADALATRVIKVQGQWRDGKVKTEDLNGKTLKYADFGKTIARDNVAVAEAAKLGEQDRIRTTVKAVMASNPDFDPMEVLDLVVAGKTVAEVEEELG